MRSAVITVTALALACGDTVAPVGGQPTLAAVNGGTEPVVVPGEVAGWAGFGFGASQGDAAVFVTTAAGFAPAEVVTWSDAAIRARLPDDVASGPSYVVTPTDTLGPVQLFVRPGSFDPASRAWTEGAPLPRGWGGTGVAALHFSSGSSGAQTIAIQFGGLTVDTTADTTQPGGVRLNGRLGDSTILGSVDGEGRIIAWTAAPDTLIPTARTDHAMVAADRANSPLNREDSLGVSNAAYLIGGRAGDGSILADVRGISLTVSGRYGLWSGLTPLPQPRAGATAAVAYGLLFVVGGYGPDSLAARETFTARVNSDGTINGWFIGPRLPEGRAYAALAAARGMLFLTGGESGLIDPSNPDSANLTPTVFAIRVDPSTGSFRDSVWTELPAPLLHARSRHAGAVLHDALVVVGGVYQGLPGPGESEYAPLAIDGTLGTFQEVPGPTLASVAGAALWSFGQAVTLTASGAPRLLLVGGMTPLGPGGRSWTY